MRVISHKMRIAKDREDAESKCDVAVVALHG
jgi:hypothetical protein